MNSARSALLISIGAVALLALLTGGVAAVSDDTEQVAAASAPTAGASTSTTTSVALGSTPATLLPAEGTVADAPLGSPTPTTVAN